MTNNRQAKTAAFYDAVSRRTKEREQEQLESVGQSTFATRLKLLRTEKGLGKRELAQELGMSFGAICQYENGARTPSLKTQTKIANYFGVYTDYLIGRSNHTQPVNEMQIRNEYSEEQLTFLSNYKKASLKVQKAICALIETEDDSAEQLSRFLQRIHGSKEEELLMLLSDMTDTQYDLAIKMISVLKN